LRSRPIFEPRRKSLVQPAASVGVTSNAEPAGDEGLGETFGEWAEMHVATAPSAEAETQFSTLPAHVLGFRPEQIVAALELFIASEDTACALANELLAKSAASFVEVWNEGRLVLTLSRPQTSHLQAELCAAKTTARRWICAAREGDKQSRQWAGAIERRNRHSRRCRAHGLEGALTDQCIGTPHFDTYGIAKGHRESKDRRFPVVARILCKYCLQVFSSYRCSKFRRSAWFWSFRRPILEQPFHRGSDALLL